MRAAVALIGALIISGCALQRDVGQAPPTGTLGTAAPALSGQTVDGHFLSVDFTQGKTVLVFWAAWCGPCRHEQPSLNRIAADYASRGVRVYGVDMLDRDRAAALAFLHEFAVPYPNLYDDSGKVTAAYQVDYPPSVVLVDERGVVVARYPGEVSEGQLRSLIEKKLVI